jgi:hypothetical protein
MLAKAMSTAQDRTGSVSIDARFIAGQYVFERASFGVSFKSAWFSWSANSIFVVIRIDGLGVVRKILHSRRAKFQRRAALIRSRPRITLFAGQLAAAFGSVWQGGSVPPATKGLDEGDGIYHAAAENIDRSDFVGESGALSSSHFQVAGDAALVTGDGEVQILLSRCDGFVLNLSFVLEDAQCRYIVFDLLEAGQTA